jgi:hypothetical protein
LSVGPALVAGLGPADKRQPYKNNNARHAKAMTGMN